MRISLKVKLVLDPNQSKPWRCFLFFSIVRLNGGGSGIFANSLNRFAFGVWSSGVNFSGAIVSCTLSGLCFSTAFEGLESPRLSLSMSLGSSFLDLGNYSVDVRTETLRNLTGLVPFVPDAVGMTFEICICTSLFSPRYGWLTPGQCCEVYHTGSIYSLDLLAVSLATYSGFWQTA